jgi:membrane-associated protease RseP (regulator of RpoE activity)
MPLVPYIDKLVPGLPSFYFTYFIIILAIIAISHEFAHGIFAAYNKIKINSTGFGFFPFFLPVFLAAFVELDEKKMAKKSKFPQLAILSAGTFANILTAILFFGVLWIFFFFAFTPSGIIFNEYAYAPIAVSAISSVNGIQLENASFEEFISLLNKDNFNEIKTDEEKYVSVGFFTNSNEYVKLYYDAPAINVELESTILKINGEEIRNVNNLREEISKYSPGEKITLNVLGDDGNNYNKNIILGENPGNKSLPWIGVGFTEQESKRVIGKVYSVLNFKDPYIYYKSNLGVNLFIYDLLWWIILISISVALINMLPVGIFDGGRFFYLTIWGITKNEKIAKNLFAFSTYFILFLLFLLMFFWAKISFF